VRPAFVTNSADAAVTHAERGGGVALVLSYQADEQLRSGTLVRVLTPYEAPPIPIQLVHPGARLPSANVRAFTELVLSTRRWNFAGTPADR
jgi:DNA-binding transcriptional LysR family regulator